MSNQTQQKINLVKGINLDLSTLVFSDIKENKELGNKTVFINGNGQQILIQTPRMYVPNGIKHWEATKEKKESFDLDLSFGGEEKSDKNSQEIKMFHEKMQQYDEMVKCAIEKNSAKWFGKAKISREVLEEAYYKPSVKRATSRTGELLNYPDRLTTKFDVGKDDKFLSNIKASEPVLVFDEDKKQYELTRENFKNLVPNGCQVTAILKLVKISIGAKASTKWKVIQLRVLRNNTSITGYAMLDEDEEDEVKVEDEVNKMSINMENVNLVQDLDTEEEEETNEKLNEEVEEPDEFDIKEEVKIEQVPVKKTRKRAVAAA